MFKATMFKTLGVVDVYSALCRDEGSDLRRLLNCRLAGQSLIGWGVRRLIESLRIDQVVVLMPQSLVGELSRNIPSYAPIHGVEECDTLQAYARLVATYPAQAVVRVGIDNPLFDPSLVDRLVMVADRYPGVDYLGFCLDDGLPALRSRMGGLAEWFRATAIIAAHRGIHLENERQDLSRMIFNHPELFQTKLIPLPVTLDVKEFCLTLRNADDLEMAEEIVEALGPDKLDWVRMVRWIGHNPHVRQRIAERNLAPIM